MKAVRLAMIILCAGSGLLAAAGCQQTAARTQDAGTEVEARLLKLPVLTEATEGLQSLDAVFDTQSSDDAEGIRFHYVFKRPDHFGILITVGAAGQPVAMQAEGKTLYIDPLRCVVGVREAKSPPVFQVSQSKDEITVKAGAMFGEASNKGITIDMASLFTHIRDDGRVPTFTRDPDSPPGSWVIHEPAKDDRQGATYRIGPDPVCPVTSMKLGEDAHSTMGLSFRVNRPISDADLRLPDLGVLAQYVKVEQRGSADWAALMQDMQTTIAGMMAATCKTPAKRAEFEKTLGVKIDWVAFDAFLAKFKEGMAEARRARREAIAKGPELSRLAD